MIRFHIDCLTPPLFEIPEDDWYCESCDRIVQAQYDISVSSPEEDAGFRDLEAPLPLSLDSDHFSDENIDIVGSDSNSSLIVVDSESEEPVLSLLTPSSSTYAWGSSSSNSAGAVSVVSREPRGTVTDSASSAFLATPRNDVLTQPLTKKMTKLETTEGDSSSSEDEIFHRQNRHINVDKIDTSSSDDSFVIFNNYKAKNLKSIFSEDSDTDGDVDTGIGMSRQGSVGNDVTLPENSGPAVSRSSGPSTRSSVGPRTRSHQTPEVIHVPSDDFFSSVRSSGSQRTPDVIDTSNGYHTSGYVNLESLVQHRNNQLSRQLFNGQKRKSFQRKRRPVPKKRKRKKRVGTRRGRGRRRRPPRNHEYNNGYHGVQNNWYNDCNESPMSRLRARTAATHTSRYSAMRQAVKESYRHQDQTEGLQCARNVLANARLRPNIYQNRNLPLGQKGSMKNEGFDYGTSEGDNSVGFHYRDQSTPVYRTYGFTPSSSSSFYPSHLPVSKSPSTPKRISSESSHSVKRKLMLKEKQRVEIQRRLSSRGRSLSHVQVTPVRLQRNRGEYNNRISSWCTSPRDSDLVESLCGKMDDLEDKGAMIRRNGTIVSIRK